MNYLISVIIPVYNGESDIKKTINSLLNQTIQFKNIEVILIDDCSTDNSLKIMNKFSNNYSNIKVIHLNKNNGTPGYPRNIGISQSSGKFIMFLDSGDCYNKDMCETLYNEIKKENVDFISCLYYHYYNKKNNTKVKNPLNQYGPKIKINNINDFPTILEIDNPHAFVVWNKIFNKSFIMKNGIKFLDKCSCEDFYFNIQCYLNGKFILLNTFYGYIYINQFSSLNNTPSKELLNKILCGYEHIKEYLKENKYKEPQIVTRLIFGWTMNFLNNKLNNEDNKELFKRAQPLYKNFKKNFKKNKNDSKIFIILIYLIKIFYSNMYLAIIFIKLYNLFNLEKIRIKFELKKRKD